jgi:hypothetical protein
MGNVPRNVTSTNGKGWKFTKDDLIELFCVCTKIENGMGCQNLGSWIH